MSVLKFRPTGYALALMGALALGGLPMGSASQAVANADLPDAAIGVSLTQKVLDQAVVPGQPNRVRYGALAQDRAALDKALAHFAEADPALLPTDSDRLAFWINAYNISMIDGILKNWGGSRAYSVSNNGFAIFDQMSHRIAGHTYSLNEIEHGVIRGDPKKISEGSRGPAKAAHQGIWSGGVVDARVHMALNCASIGCPELRAKAYSGATLNKSLAQQSTIYVKDPARGAGPQGISEIFKWYGGDFTHLGGAAGFIQSHRQGADEVKLDAFLPYDWALNIK